MMGRDIHKFIRDQLSVWPLAAANFRALKSVETKEVKLGNIVCKVQYNPARLASSTADTSSEAIMSRKCFLCTANRPQDQFHLPFEGRKGRKYHIQVNPFPIFPGHLVIARREHDPQVIWHHFPDMLDFARLYPDYTVFYNGPMSGASAPDHLHFQAAPRHMMPLENAADSFLDDPGTPLATVKDASLYRMDGYTNGVYVLKAVTSKSLAKLFYRLLDCTDRAPEESEPKFNLFAYFDSGEFRAIITLRSGIRSHHYYDEGEDHLTISPGAADMAGVFIAPFREDFLKVTSEQLTKMLEEVSISREQQDMIDWRLKRPHRMIDVGIMSAEEISFEIISDGAGMQKVTWDEGKIAYNGMLYDELYFDSITRSTLFAEPSFILYDVVIGIDFHWQQKRTLKFPGGLKFIVEGKKITAVNHVGMEDYLMSVISSEMKASCSIELLKSHAVISRSWLISRLNDRLEGRETPHELFDVCADDHCQRYQGLTMAVGENVRKAIDQTWGQVLEYEGKLCDTRYSKCCGGKTELFSTCWEDVDYPYLQCVDDPYCNCENDKVLFQVLNDYDVRTHDFHDWKVCYTADELSELVRRRSGIDFGTVTALEPVELGPSGRIKFLRIVGTKHTEIIGKELKIRRFLSESHLKSSAFTVKHDGDVFILEGKGWGHGVGLCQIGAAVMAEKGFSYKNILSYYYPGAEVK